MTAAVRHSRWPDDDDNDTRPDSLETKAPYKFFTYLLTTFRMVELRPEIVGGHFSLLLSTFPSASLLYLSFILRKDGLGRPAV